MLDLSDELLGVVRIETEHLAEAFEADVLQVTVSQGLHTGVGFNHFLLGQAVRANQVAPAWKVDVQLELWLSGLNDLRAIMNDAFLVKYDGAILSISAQHRVHYHVYTMATPKESTALKHNI